jgi:hypothetical protein
MCTHFAGRKWNRLRISGVVVHAYPTVCKAFYCSAFHGKHSRRPARMLLRLSSTRAKSDSRIPRQKASQKHVQYCIKCLVSLNYHLGYGAVSPRATQCCIISLVERPIVPRRIGVPESKLWGSAGRSSRSICARASLANSNVRVCLWVWCAFIVLFISCNLKLVFLQSGSAFGQYSDRLALNKR